MQHYDFMRKALALAEQGIGATSPNPMVGAVIVDDTGQIVGEGYHQKAGTPHAEIHALEAAGTKARGATLYVNLEPCSHYGRTPPCVSAIMKAGLKQVVVAMTDPNPVVAGRGIELLGSHGIKVVTGILEDEAKYLNRAFTKSITTGKPFVTMKVAMTLDGKIASRTGDAKWITGAPAREMVHQLRHQVDAIMVGINTVLADDPRLTTRLASGQGQGRDPLRVILDSRLTTPLDSQIIVQRSTAKTVIMTTQEADGTKASLLVKAGAEVVIVPTVDGYIDLNWVMNWLGQRGINHVLLEGGSTVNYSAIAAGLVDECWLFYAPIIIGGTKAPTGVGGLGGGTIAEAVRLEDITVDMIGKDILVRGNVVKGV